jgi:long-chain fatty acid transport protein
MYREAKPAGAALLKSALMATTSVAALLATMGTASAGGFAIREQSTVYQGMSFAGSAAGDTLGSMYWNPAAAASEDGLNTESSFSIIAAESNVHVTSSPFLANPADSGDIGPPAFVGASYGNYQLSKDVYIGMAVNAPFGLKTDPVNVNYQGAVIAQKTELQTYNFNPTVAVRVAPGITVGAGVQIQSADGTFRFASGVASGPTTAVTGNGWGFGGTAGITIEASPTTLIGIGYRSQMDQEIEGRIYTVGTSLSQKTDAELNLPDIVTASIRQIVTPKLRISGTFEWTNWSRFKDLTVTVTEDGASVFGQTTAGTEIASLPFNWSDGYFVSLGGEYDLEPGLVGRFGVGYEWSPIDSPEKRSTGIPDNNRVWLSGGFSWQFTPTTTIDFAATHLFVEDSGFERVSLSGVPVSGEVESKVDILSVGVRTHW